MCAVGKGFKFILLCLCECVQCMHARLHVTVSVAEARGFQLSCSITFYLVSP